MYIKQLLRFIICVPLTLYTCNASLCKNAKEKLQTTQVVTDITTRQVALESTTTVGNQLNQEVQTNKQDLQDDRCLTEEVEFTCGQELRPYTGKSKYVQFCILMFSYLSFFYLLRSAEILSQCVYVNN